MEGPWAATHTVMPVAVKRAPPLPPATHSYHRLRKGIHLLCFLAFLSLPYFNVLRFDLPRQRFYFAGYELWINEFSIVFFAMMFLMFVIVVASVFYGRVYCGYLCPQMIFSEASIAFEKALEKRVTKRWPEWPAHKRRRLARAILYIALAVVSVFLAFTFISFFVEPRDLLRRLLSLDIHTAAGIGGAAVTLIAFLDFALVRQHFCTNICPYGYLQGMLGDQNTLLVHYRDDKHECIECKKCVRVCHMEIDIRTSPFQIQCVHCGECIDACEDVMRRIGTPGLIHYTWGEQGQKLGLDEPWLKRLGLRDAKRFIVLVVLLFYASGLFVALSMRRAVLVRVSPIRNTLYTIGPDGAVHNQFRFTIANRGKNSADVVFSITQLPGAKLTIARNPVSVPAGNTTEGTFEIMAYANTHLHEVNHFDVVATTTPEKTKDSFAMTFLTPSPKETR